MAQKQKRRAQIKHRPGESKIRSIDQAVARIRDSYVLAEYDACYNTFSQLLGSTNIDRLPIEIVKIAAWAAYRVDKYNAAYDWMSTISASSINDNDRLLQTLVNFEYRDFSHAITAGEPLMQLDRHAEACAGHKDAKVLHARFFNSLGMSQHNLGNNREAVALLTRAVEVNNDYPQSYINLATVLGRLGDLTGKRRAISDGLVHCAQKRDLQKLALEFLGDETISLCMIVKNEEAMLAKCLDSVSGAVDEIIVVDTGSQDRTVEIAKRYGARVYHHPWEDSFSLARNQSLSYATGDWILIMDADEVMQREDHAKLRQATRIPDYNIVSLSVHNCRLDSNIQTSFLPSVRLWRRKLDCHYEGIVHNELRLPTGEPVLRGDIRIIHYGYGLAEDKMRQKLARSKELLTKQLEENPDSAFSHFNYSQLIRGEYAMLPPDVCNDILMHSKRAVELSDPNLQSQRHIHLMALDQMVSAYYFMKEYDQAEACVRKALAIDPNYIDALFSLGHLHTARRDFSKAIAAYERFIQVADEYDPGSEVTNYILQHPADQATAYFRLGLIYEELQQDDQASVSFQKALDYEKDRPDALIRLAMISYRRGDLKVAKNYATQIIVKDAANVDAQLLLADIARRTGDYHDARRQCKTILDSHPDHYEAKTLMVAISRDLANTQDALLWLGAILESHPDDNFALTTQAEILMSVGRHADALPVLTELVRLYPDSPEAALALGNCFFKLSDFANAVETYLSCLAINPEMAIARRNLGYSYFKLGDVQNALANLHNYLDLTKADFEITYLVSRLHFDQAEFGEAITYLERTIQLHPDLPELISMLADCYLKLGHLQSARLGYRKALQIDPSFQPAQQMSEHLDRLIPDSTVTPITNETIH
jgi:tetratricopeptide (TPR) repeat protein